MCAHLTSRASLVRRNVYVRQQVLSGNIASQRRVNGTIEVNEHDAGFTRGAVRLVTYLCRDQGKCALAQLVRLAVCVGDVQNASHKNDVLGGRM